MLLWRADVEFAHIADIIVVDKGKHELVGRLEDFGRFLLIVFNFNSLIFLALSGPFLHGTKLAKIFLVYWRVID